MMILEDSFVSNFGDFMKNTLSQLLFVLVSILVGACTTYSNGAFERLMSAEMGLPVDIRSNFQPDKVIVLSKTEKKYIYKDSSGCQIFIIAINGIQKEWGYMSEKNLCLGKTYGIGGPF